MGARRGSSYGNLTHADPRFEITALCDANHDSLAAYQRALGLDDSRCFTEYDALLAAGGFDATIVCTPIPYHAEQSASAMDAGFHVMSEVTAANTVDGCAKIVEAARRTGKTYMLAENTCHRPLFAEWRRLLDSGRLGEPIYAEADYIHPIPQLLVDADTGQQMWRAERPPIHYCSHSLG
ncbi:Gfo/Idh/MocA family oxidoreductase, partial [Candidatus Poribacteria bacterium]|nr:Gfo/Idh/MocA family oxidoreductase [Candidatus Poribacteria bacterium]